MVSHTTWIVFAHLVYLIQMAKVMRMNLHNGDKTNSAARVNAISFSTTTM